MVAVSHSLLSSFTFYTATSCFWLKFPSISGFQATRNFSTRRWSNNRFDVAPSGPGSEILSETASTIQSAFTPSPLDDVNDMVAQVDDELESDPSLDDDSPECMIGTMEVFDGGCLPLHLVSLPRHSHAKVNRILEKTEKLLRDIHVNSTEIELATVHMAKEAGRTHERIYANNYVDLGKINT